MEFTSRPLQVDKPNNSVFLDETLASRLKVCTKALWRCKGK